MTPKMMPPRMISGSMNAQKASIVATRTVLNGARGADS